MAYLMIVVVDDIDQCPELFDAYEAIGITGMTILESTGLGRIRNALGYRDDLPLMPSLRNLMQTREAHHRTLLIAVKNETRVDEVVAATELVLGDLNKPHTGVILVLPVARVVGLDGFAQAEEDAG